MAEMDQGIKRLIQTRPADVVRLVLKDAEFINPITTDVATEPQLVLDTLYRMRYQGVECAVNIEAQASPDPAMAHRCFEYAARAMIVHKLLVISVVLWLKKQRKVPQQYHMQVADLDLGTWNIFNIEVYALQARDIITSGNLGLLPLVPFMQGADLATITEAAQVVKDRASDDEVKSLEALLAVFTARFHGNEVARAMIRRLFVSTEILDESPLYREWVDKATAEGMKKGIQQGIAEGKSEGMRLMVRRALEGRFGTVSEALLTALAAAPQETLDAIIMHIATDSLETVHIRLGLA